VAYSVLPAGFPALHAWRPAVELGLPTLLGAGLVLRERLVIGLLAAGLIAQLAVAAALAWVLADGAGLPASGLAPHGSASALARGSANVSLLFLCASLPLFLAGEVRGGGRTARRVIPAAVVPSALVLAACALPFAALAGSAVATVELPGRVLALVYSGAALAGLVTAAVAVSELGVVCVEFMALVRVAPFVTGWTARRAAAVLAGVWLAGDAASLVNPEWAYERLLTPALLALYASNAMVFAVYPLFERRHGIRSLPARAAAAAALGLMVFGAWVAVEQQPYT
jgi:hypothetical protein